MDLKAELVMLKNAVANVMRGGAAALVAILLPPFLTRYMRPDAFGTWCLVLQVSAYVGYLDFGIQTAVGRFVAHDNERGEANYGDGIVSTALAALSTLGVLGIVASVPVALRLSNIFPQMPPALAGDARLALLLVAASLAVGLPASVFNGVFVGLQRNEVPAAIIGGSRIFSAVLLVLVAHRGGPLVQMGATVAAVNLGTYLLQYFIYRKLVPGSRPSVQLISRKAGRELFDYCLSLCVWSFAMLLVTGLDLALVGHFQFEAVAYYAVAASLIAFLTGLQNAVFGVMIPSTAVLHVRGDTRELGRVMITATRYGAFLLLLTGLPLILAATNILTMWVGPTYGAHGQRILQVLVAANMIRLSAVAYVMTLIGTGDQRLVTFTPTLEGISNLLVSVVGGYLFGAIGVAVGTLIGALVGVGGNFLYNMRRTTGMVFRISDYLIDGLLRPGICALPLVIYVTLMNLSNLPDTLVRHLFLAVVLLATGFLLWRWGLVDAERERLRSWRLALQV